MIFLGLASNLWRHGGPTAAFVHLCTAMCFLLPSLLILASETSEFFDVRLFRSLLVLALAFDNIGETCSYLQLFKYLISKIIN